MQHKGALRACVSAALSSAEAMPFRRSCRLTAMQATYAYTSSSMPCCCSALSSGCTGTFTVISIHLHCVDIPVPLIKLCVRMHLARLKGDIYHSCNIVRVADALCYQADKAVLWLVL